MKNIFFITYLFLNEHILTKSKYKGDNSVKTKRGFPIKKFRSELHVLIQIILLHGFDVCISIVRLSRYVIKTCI